MSKPIGELVDQTLASARRPDEESNPGARRLFAVMHGMYGNLFLSRYATGEHNDSGKDKGVLGAMRMWGIELADFRGSTIEAAMNVCKERYPDFPPTLPQFLAACRAIEPRRARVQDHPQVKALPMGAELRSAISRRIREESLAKLRARMDERTGYVETAGGLSGLKQLVAKAIALAGGDEVEALTRLDREIGGAA